MKDRIVLDEIQNVYMIGIKGSGMIAFVEIFKALGKNVSGSDVSEKFFTDTTLEKLGIEYAENFSTENISKQKRIDLVIYSTAYNEVNNVELKYAKENNLPVLSYSEMIGLFSKEKKTVAVCGTHGKTTTSAMTTLVLKKCGADPTAIIGSRVKQLDSNVAVGESEILIIEADEYQNKLANYFPFGVVLLNVDYDHPDFFPSIKEYQNVFVEFVEKIPKEGFLIVCGDDAGAIEVAKKANCNVVVYGFFKGSKQVKKIEKELRIAGVENLEFFPVPVNLNMKVPGKHNKSNATAALAVCKQLELDFDKAVNAIEGYIGVTRRFEEIGERNGAIIIDDYAHHPAEIKATLSAAKEKFQNKNIICIFHPHTFTRTKALFSEFAESFVDADEVIVLDIYGSAREIQGGVSSEELVTEIKKFHKKVSYVATIEEVFFELKDRICEKDIVLTIGAGDVDRLAKKLVTNS